MAEQHQKVFTGLGLSPEDAKAIDDMTPEQLKDFTGADYVGKVKTGLETALLNDNNFLAKIPEDKVSPDIRKKIESGQYARFMNEITEVAKKKLGLEDKDFEDLSEADKKSLKTMVEKVAVKYVDKKGNVAGLQKMQTDLSAATEALEKKDTEWQEKLTKELEKNNGVANTKLIKTITKVELASLENVKLSVAPGYLVDPVLADLQSKYNAVIVLDEQDNPHLKQKANPALDVMVDNKVLPFATALKTVVLEKKLGVDSTKEQDDPTKTRKKVVVGGGGNSGEGGEGGDVITVPDYIQNKIDKNPELKPE